MNDVTHILSAIERGDPRAADALLPLVYDELRKLAASRLAREKPGQTLQATALVHEAYVRLVGPGDTPHWDGRGHFFAAAAEAMRRILVDNARRKQAIKRGGTLDRHSLELEAAQVAAGGFSRKPDILALDEALGRLAGRDAEAAELVKLRFFAGMTMPEACKTLGLAERTGARLWTYARSFLAKEMAPSGA